MTCSASAFITETTVNWAMVTAPLPGNHASDVECLAEDSATVFVVPDDDCDDYDDNFDFHDFDFYRR